MELTWEEVKCIANRLREVVSDNFHDAIFNNLSKDVDYGFEVSDEDIEKIKEQLKRIL